jgi:hypothetical protein
MRTFVPWGPMAISVLALAAPLAAQGRGRDQQDNNRGQARAQQESRFRADGRTNGVGRRQMDDRARGQARAQAPAREQARVQAQDRARVDVRARDQARAQWGRTPADNRGRVNDRGRVYDNGGRVYDRGREAERWGGDARWREDHARIVVQFFSSPRYHYAPRYAYQSLPYGWDRVVYENGYFPPEYDAWCDNVPVDLEYQLPPLYRGYRRFIFGDRLIVIDRITRNIVLVVRI